MRYDHSFSTAVKAELAEAGVVSEKPIAFQLGQV